MAFIESVLVGLGALVGGRSPGQCHHRTGAGPDLGDDAGGGRRPDDVVAAVVLSGDAVQALDVDGVGCADGGSSSAPQATQLGMISLPGVLWPYRNCSETTP